MTLKFQVLSSDPWPIYFENHSEQLHTVPKKICIIWLTGKVNKMPIYKKKFYILRTYFVWRRCLTKFKLDIGNFRFSEFFIMC